MPESACDRPVSQVPAADVRGGGRPGSGGADALERDREREDPAGLPLRRAARDREDLDGADPREVDQLQARADRAPRQHLSRLRRDHERHVPRRDRDGRRLTARNRRHPGDPRPRRAAAGRGPLEGLHPRRGPSVDRRRLERAPEADRGAAAAPAVHLLHDRPRQGAADRALPLPDVRVPAAAAARARAQAAADRRRRGDPGARRRAGAGGPGRARRLPRRGVDPRPARLGDERDDQRGRRARAARDGRRRGAVSPVRPRGRPGHRGGAHVPRGAVGAGAGSRPARDRPARAPSPPDAGAGDRRGAGHAPGHRRGARAVARAGEPARGAHRAAVDRPAARRGRGPAPGRGSPAPARAGASKGDSTGIGSFTRVGGLSAREVGAGEERSGRKARKAH